MTIESQILYHAPLKFVPGSRMLYNTGLPNDTESKVWTVSDTQASGFVNTEQWTLGTLVEAFLERVRVFVILTSFVVVSLRFR